MKDAFLKIRLTTEEKGFIKQQAKAAGIPASAYVRTLALGNVIQTKTDVEMIKKLNSLGGLCNTLWKQGADPKATWAAFKALEAAAARLAPR